MRDLTVSPVVFYGSAYMSQRINRLQLSCNPVEETLCPCADCQEQRQYCLSEMNKKTVIQ